MSSNRRGFLTSTLMAGAAGFTAAGTQARPAQAADKVSVAIPPGSIILFQGDSITDTGRSRETADTPNLRSTLGSGYAWMAGSHLLVDHPDSDLKVFNRGISGNKVPDLARRWDAVCLRLKPDILSILIGVNDIWHRRNGKYDGTLESYEAGYRELLQRTKEALPDVKLVLCEPFVLKCGAIDDSWFPEFDGFRAAARKLSEEFKTVFVPFQTAFDRAVAYAQPKDWAGDGVHPSPYGAALMAHEWLRHVYGHGQTA